MKKIALVVAVLMFAAPAWATTVTITAHNEGGGVVRLDYSVSDSNLVRAFGLDITVDTAVITDVNCLNSDYYIYPGSIVIVGNQVTNYGSCVCPNDQGFPDTLDGIDTNGVTVEMGSLYASNDPCHPNAPPLSGTLLKLTVSADCNLTITGNAARTGTGSGGIGAVLEDPTVTPDMILPSDHYVPPIVVDCMKSSHPDHTNWLFWNKPDCWCYARQCRGDIDGLVQGPFWVSLNDLIIFRQAVSKLQTYLQANPHLICADIDHKIQGPFWVSLNDLVIFRLYVSKLATAVPCCDADGDCVLTAADNFNDWKTP
jgi:hypothetical protein